MNRVLAPIGVVLAIGLFILLNSFFIVKMGQQAIVLQLGESQRVVNAGDAAEEGLHFKFPFVQSVQIYDKRNLGYELDAEEIIASDQQRLIVDAIARYRIRDPLQFFRAASTPANGEAQLRQRLIAALRGELGKVTTPDIISGQRAQLMQRIRDTLNTTMASFGVDVIDVRIRRADLPAANSQRVFDRMKAELNQKAALYRAEGEEEFTKIVAEADRTVQVTIAEANETSQKVRGEGDARRNAIYAAAYGRDPEFFAFYRSMQAYEKSFQQGTPFVVTPDSEFFRYFGDQGGRSR
ncbi:protease modulator HflC [bacterium]|nr:protease modulator HflC [bacterium]